MCMLGPLSDSLTFVLYHTCMLSLALRRYIRLQACPKLSKTLHWSGYRKIWRCHISTLHGHDRVRKLGFSDKAWRQDLRIEETKPSIAMPSIKEDSEETPAAAKLTMQIILPRDLNLVSSFTCRLFVAFELNHDERLEGWVADWVDDGSGCTCCHCCAASTRRSPRRTELPKKLGPNEEGYL